MKKDPFLADARAALRAYEEKQIKPEAAMDTVWKCMKLATDAGHSGDPYVTLTDKIRFEDEVEADSDRDYADAVVASGWKDDE